MKPEEAISMDDISGECNTDVKTNK